HDVDDVGRSLRLLLLLALLRFGFFLGLASDDVFQPLLDGIAHHRRIPGLGLVLDYLADERNELRLRLLLFRLAEYLLRVAHLVAIAERPEDDALAPRLQHHRPLAAREDQPRDSHGFRGRHGLADDGERLLSHLVFGHQVVGRLIPNPLDAVGRNELLDVDRAGAFEPDRLELLVLDDDVAALFDLVAPDLVLLRHRLSRIRIDIAAANAVAGLRIDRVKAHLLALCRRRRQGYRTGDQRKLQIAFPVGARRHGTSFG